jgi:ELWxxDGT repeat protein
MVRDIRPGSAASNPSWLTNVSRTIYFSANDGIHGAELWGSDGTEAGTLMLADVYPGEDRSPPKRPTAVGGTVFFSAYTPATGRELWSVHANP